VDYIYRWLHYGGISSCKILSVNPYICDSNRGLSYSVIFVICFAIGIIGSYLIGRLPAKKWMRGVTAIVLLVVCSIVIIVPNITPQIVAVIALQLSLGLLLGICAQWTAPFIWRNRGAIGELFDRIRAVFGLGG
jgi:hypothetical protein